MLGMLSYESQSGNFGNIRHLIQRILGFFVYLDQIRLIGMLPATVNENFFRFLQYQRKMVIFQKQAYQGNFVF